MIEPKLSKWASVHSYTLYKCIIQAESATTIGWLLYSNNYTDITMLRSKLQAATSFEWGFRYQTITKTDVKTDWRKRLKAISLVVPSIHAEIATYVASEMFYQKPTVNRLRDYEDCFAFVEPEYMMTDPVNSVIYDEMINRQQYHTQACKAQVVCTLTQPTYRVLTTRDNQQITFEQMILNIPIPDEELKHLSLFRSVDFVPDTSKIWLNGSPGPGGPGHIFTYYDWVAAEAVQFIRGLGVYLAYKYGFDTEKKCFTINHWRATTQWKYIPEQMCFDTPEI